MAAIWYNAKTRVRVKFRELNMSKIILDADLKARLNGLDEELELCDTDGRTLGHFIPPEMYRELMYAWAKAQFANEEELEKARQEPGGLTTAEAIAYLEALARSKGPG